MTWHREHSDPRVFDEAAKEAQAEIDKITAKKTLSDVDIANVNILQGRIQVHSEQAREARDAELAEMRQVIATGSPVGGNAFGARDFGADSELKEFLTPGSAVKDYWVKPPREQVQGRASQFAGIRDLAYLTSDTTTTGAGYFFTTELYREVIMGLVDASGVLEANPTVIITNHLRDILAPVLQVDAAATAGVEGVGATETNTEGDAITLGHYRYDGFFKIPVELAMSAEYNLDTLLATFASRAIAAKVAEVLALGDGSTEPDGLFHGATVGKQVASETAVTPEEMIALTKSVGKGYRKNARLVVSDALHTAMLSWRDDSAGAGTGQFLLRSLEDGGYQFAGKPVYVEPQADQTGMSDDEIHAVYGDTSGYFVRMTPMLFHKNETSDPLNLVYTFAIWIDAKIGDAAAVRSLKMKSGT
jgi:HK97 family phage major capsid protein